MARRHGPRRRLAAMARGAASLSTDGVDRISALHDDLLHRIITRLPVAEAARTAALASRWRHLWRSTPLVLASQGYASLASLATASTTRAEFWARVLTDHPGPFLSVSLFFSESELLDLHIELANWPRILAAKRLQKLSLACAFNRLNLVPDNLLPADILRCDSLQELDLFSFEFPAGTDVFLPRLRHLTLTNIAISDQDLEQLVAASPVLETLELAMDPPNPKHVRLRSQSLRCATLMMCCAQQLTVVDTPLLERLYLYLPPHAARVKIAHAPLLQLLAYMDLGLHKLQIGDRVILSSTMASASTMLPSVKVLALTVNFSVFKEVNMLASFLGCFPNVDTLYVESAHDPSLSGDEDSRRQFDKLWQELSPAYCLRSHVKKMVVHDFRGGESEFEFVKFIARNAQKLQSFLVISHFEILVPDDKEDEIKGKLQAVWFQTGIRGVLLICDKSVEVEWACDWRMSSTKVYPPLFASGCMAASIYPYLPTDH